MREFSLGPLKHGNAADVEKVRDLCLEGHRSGQWPAHCLGEPGTQVKSWRALTQWARSEVYTPLPWHAPPRLCGDPIAGADRRAGDQRLWPGVQRREGSRHISRNRDDDQMAPASPPTLDELRRLAPVLQSITAAHGGLGLQVFGLVVHGPARPGSDLDLLVEFPASPSFEQVMDLKLALEDLLSVPVDLVTRRGLRAELRQRIENEAVPLASARGGPGRPGHTLHAP